MAKGDTHSFFRLRTTQVVTHLRDHWHVPSVGEREALDGSPCGSGSVARGPGDGTREYQITSGQSKNFALCGPKPHLPQNG